MSEKLYFNGINGYTTEDLKGNLQELHEMMRKVSGAAAALENSLRFACAREDKDLTRACAASAELIEEKAELAAALAGNICDIMRDAEKKTAMYNFSEK